MPRVRYSSVAWYLAAVVFALLTTTVLAETPRTGTVTGRVFNPATGEYVRNAEVRIQGTDLITFSEDGGFYQLLHVQAGEAEVAVKCTGYLTATAKVTVRAGEDVTSDFNIVSESYRKETKGDTVSLAAFVVSADREGDSKAIQERRASTTIANVVSADSLGDITEGNIGDFLKYQPGFTFIASDNGDAQFGSVGGLESQYLSVGVNGARLGGIPSDFVSEGDQGARAFNFTQTSINNIESISIKRTVSADDDGDSPAGIIDLRTKSPFDVKGRRIDWQINGTVNQYDATDALRFHKSPGPNDADTYKIFPGVILGYSDVLFNKKIGVIVNTGLSQASKNGRREEDQYSLGAGRGARVSQLRFQDSPGWTKRYNLNLGLEYRPTLKTRIYFDGSYNYQDIDTHSRQIQLNPGAVDTTQTSLTRIVPTATNTTGSFVTSGSSSRSQTKSIGYGTRFEHWTSNWKFDGLLNYSRSDRNDGSLFKANYLGAQNVSVTGLSWKAERDTPLDADWHITQISGPNWFDPANWKTTGNASGQDGLTWGSELTGKLNASVDMKIKVPVKLSFGVAERTTQKHFDLTNRKQFLYRPPGIATNAITLPSSPQPVNLFMGETGLFPLLFPSREIMGQLLREHPDYFLEVARGDSLSQMLRRDKDAKEEDRAAYVKITSRIRKLVLDAGVRFEQLDRTIGKVNILADSKNPYAAAYAAAAADNSTYFNPATQAATIAGINNYVMTKYYNGIPSRTEALDHYSPMLRGALQYALFENTELRAGYGESVQPPNLSDVAGEPVINLTNMTYQIPNPTLQPQSVKRYSIELAQYFKPTGSFTIYFSQSEIKNAVLDLDELTAAEILALDPSINLDEYAGYTFTTRKNVGGGAVRINRSVEFEYKQQYTMLPGILSGLGAFATYAHNTTNQPRNRFVPKSASGGINFKYRRFSANLRGVWADDLQASITTNVNAPGGSEIRYLRKRISLDTYAEYRVSTQMSIYFSGKNITNEPTIFYYRDTDGRLERSINNGALWTLGLKGTF